MAKKKKITHRKKKFTLSIAVVAGLLPGTSRMISHARAYGFNGLAKETGRIWLGYDKDTGRFQFDLLRYGTAPAALGVIVHKVASKLGINRMMAQAGIPWIRL